MRETNQVKRKLFSLLYGLMWIPICCLFANGQAKCKKPMVGPVSSGPLSGTGLYFIFSDFLRLLWEFQKIGSVTSRAQWCAGTFPYLRGLFLDLPVRGSPRISWTIPFPFLVSGLAYSLPAPPAALTSRRRVSTSHLVANSLFQLALYSFKSLFESLNGSHFGFSKTNMGKNTQCPLSMMDTQDPLKFPVAKVWLIIRAIFLPRYLCGGFSSNYGSWWLLVLSSKRANCIVLPFNSGP